MIFAEGDGDATSREWAKAGEKVAVRWEQGMEQGRKSSVTREGRTVVCDWRPCADRQLTTDNGRQRAGDVSSWR